MAQEKSVTVELAYDREHKKVHRYAEEDSDNPTLGKIYVGKAVAKKLGDPKKIKVTIEAA